MTRITYALRWLLLAVALSFLTGCAAFYVDGNAPEIPTTQFNKPATPAEVQLIWEFQTKGVANAQATAYLKTRVREQLAASGLFTKVSDEPVNSGALLSITINNIPLNDDAFAKGFVAGLTFGIAGQTVGDGYTCTMRYTPARTATSTLEKTGKHVIYTSLGSGGPPPGAVRTSGAEEAITVMLKQLLSRTLNDLSQDPNFP